MLFCGIDEAGRGPLAGPVVVAAVIISSFKKIEGVKDSKRISERKRNFLFEKIVADAIEYKISIIDNKTIDDLNILQSTMLGIEECITNLISKPDKFIIDGNYLKLRNDYHKCINYETIVKGDDKFYEISCASIIAKVTRDRIMKNYDTMYPVYGFCSNKGYGTDKHINAIKKHGLCPIHRKSFLKNIILA